jgi:hypothetical protein
MASALAAVVVLAGPGCRVDSPVDNAKLRLDFNGGGYDLPPRPVIVFFVDGLQPDVLSEMAEAGELPRLKLHLLDRAASVDNAVTGLPSITYANAATMITGRFPGHHGISGNKFFDRRSLVYRDYGTLRTMGKANGDLTAPTIYEMLGDRQTAVVLMQVNRGVKMPFDVYPIEGGLEMGAAWGLGLYEMGDRFAGKRLREIGRESAKLGRWPDYTLVYMPGPDHIAHAHGHRSPQYRSALRNLDEAIGGVLSVLEEQGVLDRFTVALVSDHGHVETPRPGKLAIEDLLQRLDAWPVKKRGWPREIAAIGPDEASRYVDRHDFFAHKRAVVVREGDRVAHLHIRVGDDWAVRPGVAIRSAWAGNGNGHCNGNGGGQTKLAVAGLPRVAAGKGPGNPPAVAADPTPGTPGETVADDPEELIRSVLAQPAVGHVAMWIGREDGTGPQTSVDSVGVRSRDGLGLIERRVGPVGQGGPGAAAKAYRYKVISGEDPLGYAAVPRAAALCDGGWHSSREWLEATASAEHPDAVPQLAEMFDNPRVGDVVIFAAPGHDFDPHNLGGHGGMTRGDMRIPFYIAGPGIVAGRKLPAARLADLTPTLLDLMGLGERLKDYPGLDGVSLAERLTSAAPTVARKGSRE